MILLVQGHELSRYASAEILRDHGYQVVEAETAGEALALLEQHRVKLLIADSAEFYSTTIALRNSVRLRWPEMPVLVLRHSSEAGAAPPDEPFIRFLDKPIDAGALQTAVGRLLNP